MSTNIVQKQTLHSKQAYVLLKLEFVFERHADTIKYNNQLNSDVHKENTDEQKTFPLYSYQLAFCIFIVTLNSEHTVNPCLIALVKGPSHSTSSNSEENKQGKPTYTVKKKKVRRHPAFRFSLATGRQHRW